MIRKLNKLEWDIFITSLDPPLFDEILIDSNIGSEISCSEVDGNLHMDPSWFSNKYVIESANRKRES
jgi:hypothetical protein